MDRFFTFPRLLQVCMIAALVTVGTVSGIAGKYRMPESGRRNPPAQSPTTNQPRQVTAQQIQESQDRQVADATNEAKMHLQTRVVREPVPTKESPDDTVVDIISADSSFSTLVKLLQSARLIHTLEGKGPFTLFVANDAAFTKLPPSTLQTLLKPENKEKLKQLVSYHIVPRQLVPAELKSGKVKTLNGKELDIKVAKEGISVNNAKVIRSVTIGNNGIVYIVDAVLQP